MSLLRCPDCGQLISTLFPMHDCKPKAIKWKAGDLFFMPQSPTRIFRVRRVKGQIVYFVPNHYGEYPPKGTIRNARFDFTFGWVKVESDYMK